MGVPEIQYPLSIEQIKAYLPHRAPFLLIDRILKIDPQGDPSQGLLDSSKEGTVIRSLKNVSYNEPFFQGHFPRFAVMPGVLLIEAMAQTASFALYPFVQDFVEDFARDFQVFLVGADRARFRQPVVPGDTVEIEAKVSRIRGRLWFFECVATVDGKKVAETELKANFSTGALEGRS